MDDRALFSELKNLLADLYLEPNNAKRIAADAGLDLAQISFDTKAANNWHNILIEAIQSNTVDGLLKKALGEYPRNKDLVSLYETYHHFIASGGSFGSLSAITKQHVEGVKIDIKGDVSGVVAGRDVIIQRLDPADERNQRHHRIMCQLVSSFWIDGVLKSSLYNEVRIQLNLEKHSDAVDNRPNDVYQRFTYVDLIIQS